MKKIVNAIKRFAMEKKKAFTLIELMGVLVIIGILTVILIPVINNTIKNNKEELYNKQLDLIKLSAKNLASDNEYILPEEVGDEIYITLGQLRAMGYAEETIINPKTKENFPDNLVVMIIKVGKDYDYEIILDGGEVISTSGIIVYEPSKKYIKKGNTSSYIITAKTSTQTDIDTMEYYVDVTKSNIVLQGVGETDSSVKYKLDGNKGLYKLTVVGGEKEGYLYFNFGGLKDIKGKEIDTTEVNNEINNVNNSKQIIVDNTAPTCSWSGENTIWTNNEVQIVLSGVDNYKINNSKAMYTKAYNQSGIELATDNLSYEIEDEAGNKATCSKTVNVYYDKKAPVITSVSNPTNGNWVNYSFKVTLNATDGGSGLNEEQYSYQSNTGWIKDSATISGNTVTTDYFSAERNQLAYIRVCDKVENCSDQVSTQIRIDKTAPTCNWQENNTWTKNNVTVKVSGTDSASGMLSSQSNKSWTYSAYGEEVNTDNLSYTIKDNAGNETNCAKNVSVKHDTLAPRASCSWGAAQYNNQFGLYCNFSDVSTVTARLGYCYNKNDSSVYWTCLYKPLDSRYNDSGWQTALNYYGFNIALKNDVPSMSLKIGFKDEAGNVTGPLNMIKTS